jgi:hypothetical protein
VSGEALLRTKLSGLLEWEKQKRTERLMLTAVAYSVLLSLPVLAAKGILPASVSLFYFPPLFVLLSAAWLLLSGRWTKRDSVRLLLQLDRRLRLQERAITAWEILEREALSAAEEAVVHEAGEKLGTVDLKAQFPRRWSWQALAAAPLLILWLGLAWFDVRLDLGVGSKRAEPLSVGEKLLEFSQALKRKAEAEKLNESLKVAKALAELAEKSLGSDERAGGKLGQEIAAVRDALNAMKPGATESEASLGDLTREALAALKAELEAFDFGLRGLRPGFTAEREIGERLAQMPRLSEQLERSLRPGGGQSAQEAQKFLLRLEQEIARELDQRSLDDVKNFLALLLGGGGEGAPGEAMSADAETAQARPAPGEKVEGRGSLPGTEAGEKRQVAQPSPARAGVATHLPGILREGESSGMTWRGGGRSGESKIAEQDVVGAYRRQAEEDLAAEKIPPGLKETVRKYFLSLGMGEERK